MEKILLFGLLLVVLAAMSVCMHTGIGTQPSNSGRAVVPVNQHDCPPAYPVKGTFNRVYHVPGGVFYAATAPQQCFATSEDAEASGYIRSRQ